MFKPWWLQSTPPLPCAPMLHPDRSRPRGAGTLHRAAPERPAPWEPIAQPVDGGPCIWLPVVTGGNGASPGTMPFNLWREVGLDAHQLSSVGPMPDDARSSPPEATPR